MNDFSNHIINPNSSIQQALQQLNDLSENLTLFVADENRTLSGTVTDGDIRRGFLAGKQLGDKIDSVMFRNPRFIQQSGFLPGAISQLRQDGIFVVPIVDDEKRIIRIINLKEKRSVLPLNAILMAGGKGLRLRPLTDNLPKPLLKVGNKPVIEHNIDRLNAYGIENIEIAVGYMAGKIEAYVGDGSSKGLNIKYIRENEPLGTIGAVKLSSMDHHSCILLMNADVLTDIDFEDLYETFIKQDADMIVASIPYKLEVPYGVLEVEGELVTGLKEKPTYTYYSNAGIYIFKKELLDLIPEKESYDATDLMEKLLALKKRLAYYPILGYWLDIGKPDDFKKAQEDIKHIKL
ncbi:MAG: Nucleotidyl transferase [Bacteroidetes bacterium]|nr:Nucleotidyl transferase [Bacteroidota bacterium]